MQPPRTGDENVTLAECSKCSVRAVFPASESAPQQFRNVVALLSDGWTTEPVVCPRCNMRIRGELTPAPEGWN